MARKFTPEPGPAMDLRGWEKASSSYHAQESPAGTLGQDKLDPNNSSWWDGSSLPTLGLGGWIAHCTSPHQTNLCRGRGRSR